MTMSKTEVNVNLNLRQQSNWYFFGGWGLFATYLALSLFCGFIFNLLSAILGFVNWILLFFSGFLIFYGWAAKQEKKAILGWVFLFAYLIILIVYPLILSMFLISNAQRAIGG